MYGKTPKRTQSTQSTQSTPYARVSAADDHIINMVKYIPLINYISNKDSPHDPKYEKMWSAGPVAAEYFDIFNKRFEIQFNNSLKKNGLELLKRRNQPPEKKDLFDKLIMEWVSWKQDQIKWIMWKIFIAVLYSTLHPEDPNSYTSEQLARIVKVVSQWNMNHMFPSPEPIIIEEKKEEEQSIIPKPNSEDIYPHYHAIVSILYPENRNPILTIGSTNILRILNNPNLETLKQNGELDKYINSQYTYHNPHKVKGGKRRQTLRKRKTQKKSRKQRS